VLGDLLDPGLASRRVQTGGRQLDDAVVGAAQLVEQLVEEGVGDDGDAARSRVGAQRRRASSRCISSAAS
jgi:hypothetical protein